MKGTGPHIIKSSLYSLLQFAFPVLSLAWVSRALGPEVYGDWQWVENLCRFAVVFSALGIPWYGVKAIAQAHNEHQKTQTLAALFLIQTFALVVLSIALYVFVWNDPRVSHLGPWPFMYIVSHGFLLEWYFQGQQQYRYLLTRASLVRLLALIALMTLVHQAHDAICVFPILFFINLAFGLWNLLALWPKMKNMKGVKLAIRPHFKPLTQLAIAGFAVAAYTHSEISFLGHFRDALNVSYYAVSIKILRFALLFLGALTPVFLVQFSQKKSVLKPATALTLLYTLPVAIFVSINSPAIVELVAGHQYLAASPSLSLLAICLPLIGLSGMFGSQYLLSHEQTHAWLWAASIGLAVNLFLNYCLVPRWGLAGATWTTLITEAIVCLVCYVHVAAELPARQLGKILGQILVLLLPGLVLLIGFRFILFSPWLKLGIEALVYFGSFALLTLRSNWFGPTLRSLYEPHAV